MFRGSYCPEGPTGRSSGIGPRISVFVLSVAIGEECQILGCCTEDNVIPEGPGFYLREVCRGPCCLFFGFTRGYTVFVPRFYFRGT